MHATGKLSFYGALDREALGEPGGEVTVEVVAEFRREYKDLSFAEGVVGGDGTPRPESAR